MSLKLKYALFIIIIHTIIIVLLYSLLLEKKWLFILSEVFVAISLLLSYSLYRQLIKPLELMQTGSDALIDSDFNIKYVDTGSKEMDKLISVYNRMIDRLRNERVSMEEQSYFLNKLIDVSPIGMIIMDYDNNITDANPKVISLLNLPENWKGKKLDDFEHSLIKYISEIEIDSEKLIEVDGLKKYKCLVNNVIHRGFSRKFIILEELTNEILETEKRAYGKVIRMMAHEVNNSMGAVNSILDTIYNYGFVSEEADDELKDSLKIVIERNKKLGSFMDNFAEVIRLPKPVLRDYNINELLLRIGGFFEVEANKNNIQINYDLAENVVAKIDVIQMEQVISNIIKNSIESIESHQSDGIIIIKSTVLPLGFVIQDNGPGIKSDISNKIFSPFFSTKEAGQGIGLILCRDILQNHKAIFSLKTNNDTSLTEFIVELK